MGDIIKTLCLLGTFVWSVLLLIWTVKAYGCVGFWVAILTAPLWIVAVPGYAAIAHGETWALWWYVFFAVGFVAHMLGALKHRP